jgi:hypothetical protein
VREHDAVWVEPVDMRDNKPRVHVVEFVCVRRISQVFDVMGLSMRIYKAAQQAEGFVGGGIKAHWWVKKFWTYTAWEDRESMERFVKSSPHAEAVERVLELAAPGSCYVEWTTEGSLDWPDAVERLKRPTHYMVDPLFG